MLHRNWEEPPPAHLQLKHLKVWLSEKVQLQDQWLRKAVPSPDNPDLSPPNPHLLTAANAKRWALQEVIEEMDQIAQMSEITFDDVMQESIPDPLRSGELGFVLDDEED